MTDEQMRAEQKKWFRWLGEESESGGKIGRFEGGQYTTTGVWRPSKHSMMISIGYYFDQVSRERMVQRISEQVKLIADSGRPTRRSASTKWSGSSRRSRTSTSSTSPGQLDGKEIPAAGGTLRTWNVDAMNLPKMASRIRSRSP